MDNESNIFEFKMKFIMNRQLTHLRKKQYKSNQVTLEKSLTVLQSICVSDIKNFFVMLQEKLK